MARFPIPVTTAELTYRDTQQVLRVLNLLPASTTVMELGQHALPTTGRAGEDSFSLYLKRLPELGGTVRDAGGCARVHEGEGEVRLVVCTPFGEHGLVAELLHPADWSADQVVSELTSFLARHRIVLSTNVERDVRQLYQPH